MVAAKMSDVEDILPPLPAFLDRKLWSKLQWERSKIRAATLVAQIDAELATMRQRAEAAKEAKKVKEAIDAQRAFEKAATEERRAQKRLMRNATLAYVRRALDRGPVTANGLRQNAAEDKKNLVPWALRTMLKEGEIKRVSRQKYERARRVQ